MLTTSKEQSVETMKTSCNLPKGPGLHVYIVEGVPDRSCLIALLRIMMTYLDAVVGLGDAFVQGLTVRLQQLSLALSLAQLLLCQAQLMVQLGIRLLQHALLS